MPYITPDANCVEEDQLEGADNPTDRFSAALEDFDDDSNHKFGIQAPLEDEPTIVYELPDTGGCWLPKVPTLPAKLPSRGEGMFNRERERILLDPHLTGIPVKFRETYNGIPVLTLPELNGQSVLAHGACNSPRPRYSEGPSSGGAQSLHTRPTVTQDIPLLSSQTDPVQYTGTVEADITPPSSVPAVNSLIPSFSASPTSAERHEDFAKSVEQLMGRGSRKSLTCKMARFHGRPPLLVLARSSQLQDVLDTTGPAAMPSISPGPPSTSFFDLAPRALNELPYPIQPLTHQSLSSSSGLSHGRNLNSFDDFSKHLISRMGVLSLDTRSLDVTSSESSDGSSPSVQSTPATSVYSPNPSQPRSPLSLSMSPEPCSTVIPPAPAPSLSSVMVGDTSTSQAATRAPVIRLENLKFENCIGAFAISPPAQSSGSTQTQSSRQPRSAARTSRHNKATASSTALPYPTPATIKTAGAVSLKTTSRSGTGGPNRRRTRGARLYCPSPEVCKRDSSFGTKLELNRHLLGTGPHLKNLSPEERKEREKYQMERTCDVCGSELTRKDSLKRHKDAKACGKRTTTLDRLNNAS
ncbi:hypothetical protein D9615_009846 [Tricholomella constricta]|uniref:Uncharacterized protein n=1 Tax=Tricholomella constricta TaxID=117010 RepID=A0A8H5GX63_9AGAR|nr:hypothetical protein D9615_009846 [Tricholomella constricta]